MPNSETILAGSTSATNVTLRNADDGSLRIMTGATPTEVMKIPAGGIPAFSAYLSANQSFSSGNWTTVNFNIDSGSSDYYDVGNTFNTSTYTFQPSVAGYYQVNLTLQIGASSGMTGCGAGIMKNSTNWAAVNQLASYNSATAGVTVSSLVYMNGSTDNLQAKGVCNGGVSPIFVGTAYQCQFSGVLVRAA